ALQETCICCGHSSYQFLSGDFILYRFVIVFVLVILRRPKSALFPYTTLFRSGHICRGSEQKCFLAGRRIGHQAVEPHDPQHLPEDRKSTRLNSSHVKISYAVFCLKKKNNKKHNKRYNSLHSSVLLLLICGFDL